MLGWIGRKENKWWSLCVFFSDLPKYFLFKIKRKLSEYEFFLNRQKRPCICAHASFFLVASFFIFYFIFIFLRPGRASFFFPATLPLFFFLFFFFFFWLSMACLLFYFSDSTVAFFFFLFDFLGSGHDSFFFLNQTWFVLRYDFYFFNKFEWLLFFYCYLSLFFN